MSLLEDAWKDLRGDYAIRLLRATVNFETKMAAKVGISNPKPHKTPSKEGEFPRKRTGFGQASLCHEPTSLAEIAETLSVKIGYIENAFYMEWLVENMRRLGLDRAMIDLESETAEFLAGDI